MATVLGIVAMVSFFVANTDSFKAAGEISMRLGAMGLLAFLFSIAGVVLSMMSFYERDTFILFKITGIVLSFLAAICWIGIIMIGTGVYIL